VADQRRRVLAPDKVASRGVARNAGFSELEIVEDDRQTMVRYVLRRPPSPASRVTASRDAARTTPGST
jgi:hypothetical protein